MQKIVLDDIHDFVYKNAKLTEVLTAWIESRHNKNITTVLDNYIDNYVLENHLEYAYIELFCSILLPSLFVNIKEPAYSAATLHMCTFICSEFEKNEDVSFLDLQAYTLSSVKNLKPEILNPTFAKAPVTSKLLSAKFVDTLYDEYKKHKNPIDRTIYGFGNLVKKGTKNVGKAVKESEVIHNVLNCWPIILIIILLIITIIAES